jgi:hypothetical protein
VTNPRRLLYIPVFHLDTNRINSRGKLEAMNRIEKWKEDGVILINMSGVSFEEARAGNNPSRTRKANQQIFTLTATSIDKSSSRYKAIASTLFPNGIKNMNEENDVKIVYEAAHYVALLITNDGGSRSQPGGILGHREKLRDLVQIMTDDEGVSFIKRKIKERDDRARLEVTESGDTLPEWVGKD